MTLLWINSGVATFSYDSTIPSTDYQCCGDSDEPLKICRKNNAAFHTMFENVRGIGDYFRDSVGPQTLNRPEYHFEKISSI